MGRCEYSEYPVGPMLPEHHGGRSGGRKLLRGGYCFGAARCAESAPSVSAESKGWYLRVLGRTRRYSAVVVGILGCLRVREGT